MSDPTPTETASDGLAEASIPAPSLFELPRVYDPLRAEARFYPWWEQSGFFKGDPTAPGEPYCIVIPPPNVTGSLHLGHALDNTLQDILIRFHRMDGYNTVWIPGTDHAGIATQWVVERELAKEGTDRHALGREKFQERIWAWKSQYGNTITHQLRRLGVSCDWSRERFTMDAMLSRAVREAFVRFYEQGLIYRDTRLINWDPIGQTALSDLEVVHEEGIQGEMWSFAYPLSEEVDGLREIVVATTRPETMLGDTAVAVHPDDPRYQKLIGKTIRHPFLDREIPIIGDSILVDPAFGTGAVKVTPAHDPNDYEVGKRHKLEFINLLNTDGSMNAQAGPFQGQDRFVCRDAVKARLREMGLERGSKVHVMAIGRSQRSGAIVEPMVSTQWFVRMKPLAGPAVAAVEHGFTRFVPKQWENFYFPWLREVKDWCISRQLWWGHRIPAWYCERCGQVEVSRQDPTRCSRCGCETLVQDPDVLDTWFSSALWPFSTLGWPEATPELAKWYPTSVLVTAFDIIFFWVARMIYSGVHHMGSVPFHEVCIHGLIRDSEGHKMSKTKGNVVDPLETIDRYGCDAFRFALAQMATQGSDIIWDETRVDQARKFVNKVWQSFRFIAMNLGDDGLNVTDLDARRADLLGTSPFEPDSIYDRWILARAGESSRRVREAVVAYRFADAANELQAFVWSEFCDWYLELSKGVLYGQDPQARAQTRRSLVRVMGAILRLMHPFMPFLSEEIWQRLLGQDPYAAGNDPKETIQLQRMPRPQDFPSVAAVLDQVSALQEAVVGVRRVRAGMNLGARAPLEMRCESESLAFFSEHVPALKHLCGVTGSSVGSRPGGVSVTIVVRGQAIYLPLEGVIDVNSELLRLGKELEKAVTDESFLARKMENPSFVERAPAAVVEETRAKLEASRAHREKVEGVIENMRSMLGPRARQAALNREVPR